MCPEMLFVTSRHDRYTEVHLNRQAVGQCAPVEKVLSSTDGVQAIGDERTPAKAEAIACRIKDDPHRGRHLRCSSHRRA